MTVKQLLNALTGIQNQQREVYFDGGRLMGMRILPTIDVVKLDGIGDNNKPVVLLVNLYDADGRRTEK